MLTSEGNRNLRIVWRIRPRECATCYQDQSCKIGKNEDMLYVEKMLGPYSESLQIIGYSSRPNQTFSTSIFNRNTQRCDSFFSRTERPPYYTQSLLGSLRFECEHWRSDVTHPRRSKYQIYNPQNYSRKKSSANVFKLYRFNYCAAYLIILLFCFLIFFF